MSVYTYALFSLLCLYSVNASYLQAINNFLLCYCLEAAGLLQPTVLYFINRLR